VGNRKISIIKGKSYSTTSSSYKTFGSDSFEALVRGKGGSNPYLTPQLLTILEMYTERGLSRSELATEFLALYPNTHSHDSVAAMRGQMETIDGVEHLEATRFSVNQELLALAQELYPERYAS
jgi:hypothetical protein